MANNRMFLICSLCRCPDEPIYSQGAFLAKDVGGWYSPLAEYDYEGEMIKAFNEFLKKHSDCRYLSPEKGETFRIGYEESNWDEESLTEKSRVE